MSDQAPVPETDQQQERRDRKGTFWRLPYDWRKPTVARAKSRLWNGDDHRLFTPKAFGWGYDLNLYWVAHPLRYLKR
jgi:hypothetical protein